MKTYFNKNASQSGRSMIEMLGVLAIVGILSAGGIAGYGMAMQSYKTTQLIEKVQLIVTRVQTLVKENDYTGIINQALIDSGKISASDLINPFGGNISVYPSGDKNSFITNLGESIPAETCSEFLQQSWGDDGIFWGIIVNDTLFRPRIGNYPVAPNDAVTVCKGGNKHVELIFK